jgi:O-antigen/teichoic acid export membrane protein
LGDDEFISITVALALFTQLSSFTLAIVALTIGLSKQKNENESRVVIEKLQTVLIHLFIVVLLAFLVTSPLYFNSLNIDPSLLLPICGMLILSIAMSVISGYLNGKQKLIKLGLALVFSAGLQLLLSASTAILTKSGVATLYAMAMGAFIAIMLTYWVYKKENLPKLSSIFVHKLDIYKSKDIRKLIGYTALSSIAVLIMNILLILDLLLINGRGIDAKIYTDIYVISRIVFFGGMLFVWPFLSNIDIYNPNHNTKLLLRITTLFISISGVSILAMYAFGNQITQILLGDSYAMNTNLKEFAILAILYKFIFLMITTITLYFIVIKSYWSILTPLLLALGTITVTSMLGSGATSIELLRSLNIVAAFGLVVGFYGFAYTVRK